MPKTGRAILCCDHCGRIQTRFRCVCSATFKVSGYQLCNQPLSPHKRKHHSINVISVLYSCIDSVTQQYFGNLR